MNGFDRVLVLGTGYTGKRVAIRARALGARVIASARREDHAAELRALRVDALLAPELDQRIAVHLDDETHVVITFPPDGATDARIAPCLAAAGAVTYVSSTAVYAELRGRIDDRTPLPPPTERALLRLEAEAQYRAAGATVLRCPGIYGPDRGIHTRLLRGDYRLPGDGSAMSSRIHVDDLVTFILRAAAVRSETFVIGDLEPAPHAEVVRWLCAAYRLPFPPSAPLADVHETLRADRAVDSARARQVLGVELAYPTFRDGMAPAATGLAAPASPATR